MTRLTYVTIAVAILILLSACGSSGDDIEISPQETIEAAVQETVNAELAEVPEPTESPESTAATMPTEMPAETPTVEPTITLTPTIEPTPEPTATLEPTIEPSPTPLCFGEEEQFNKFLLEYEKLNGSFDDDRKNNEAAYVREYISEFEKLSPPSCLEDWQRGAIQAEDMWADWLESTNDKTNRSYDHLEAYIQYIYDVSVLTGPLANHFRSAEKAVTGESKPFLDFFYRGMHDGEYISENFTISEPCEDMDYDWAAIQGNDGGYVNVELVNYETEESFTLANKVLDTRWELHSDNKPIKDVAAGEYFIRSTTFPTFFVELRCERPWE